VTVRHVILDRDGVLNREMPRGFLSSPAEWTWEDGAPEALARLASAGVAVSVVTNQSAVGRGLLDPTRLDEVHRHMVEETGRHGGRIARVLVCPHAPGDGCACRKPLPALVLEAVGRSGVAPEETLLVGDDIRDLEAGRRAGVRVALVRTGKGRGLEAQAGSAAVYDHLLAAVEAALAESRPGEGRRVAAAFAGLRSVLEASMARVPRETEEAARALVSCLRRGGKVLACGNGGSAADADHFAAELVGRFARSRRALPALALAGSGALATAVANDTGFQELFARQVEALARPGDALLAISTSGRSPNVLRAVEAARVRGCVTVALTGGDGGPLVELAEHAVVIPSPEVARIQEMHSVCLHALAAEIEAALGAEGEP
jgi:D-sedoheptulose 7-phosphate isomerase/D-glycero-D-manno-heptose 1,7-bisphosphate phosphatase